MTPYRLIPLLGLLLLSLKQDTRSLSLPPTHPALVQLPKEMLWAWERAEDLRWLPPDIGVAYVASSIMLRKDQALIRRRTASLQLAANTAVVPVLHVDVSWSFPPTKTAQQIDTITAELLRVARASNSNVVQLDFEVGSSHRAFLARTIAAARARLDPRMALSSTAIASWCLDDYWIEDLASDEVVPMAFRMGRDQHALRQRVLQQRGFTQLRCRSAIGFSSDEPMIAVEPRRHYYFSPKSWTAASWQAVRDHPRSTTYTSP
jgi:hypothetical protein